MATNRAVITIDEVMQQVRQGLNNLHLIGVAHCDICVDNIFVLDDNEIILGDLEYCTRCDSRPPDVRRRHDATLGIPANALELDEQQYSVLRDELASA
jgi:RIO-like serine/threonine protein kinase